MLVISPLYLKTGASKSSKRCTSSNSGELTDREQTHYCWTASVKWVLHHMRPLSWFQLHSHNPPLSKQTGLVKFEWNNLCFFAALPELPLECRKGFAESLRAWCVTCISCEEQQTRSYCYSFYNIKTNNIIIIHHCREVRRTSMFMFPIDVTFSQRKTCVKRSNKLEIDD